MGRERLQKKLGELILAIVPSPPLLSSGLAGSGQLLLLLAAQWLTLVSRLPLLCVHMWEVYHNSLFDGVCGRRGVRATEIQGIKFDRMTSVP